MTDYFQTLDCTGTGTPTLTRSVSSTQSATATSVPSAKRDVSIIRSVTATCVPAYLRVPSFVKSTTGAGVASIKRNVLIVRNVTAACVMTLVRFPSITKLVSRPATATKIITILKKLTASASHATVIGPQRQGASGLSIAAATNKWSAASETSRYAAIVSPRFIVLTIGD